MAFRISLDDDQHEIEIVRRRPHLVVRIDGREHEVSTCGSEDDGRQAVTIAGATHHFARAHLGDRQVLRLQGRTHTASMVDPRTEADAAGGLNDLVRAPMPGAVVSLSKAVGDAVKRGETVLTIESMKLQTALVAPRDGVVAEIARGEGETFEKDEVIVRLEAAEQD